MQAIRKLMIGLSGASWIGIAAATALPFALGWIFFPQSVGGISGMLPFAAILMLAAVRSGSAL